METLTIIAILLGIIAILLNRSINEQMEIKALLEKTWSGLFNTQNSGLPMLSYLQYIDNKLEKIEKIKEENKH